MLSVKECIAHQAECAHQARLALSAKRRETLFAMSRTWETLAKQAARLEATPEGACESPDVRRRAEV